jgi:amino acid adenylation domain-containing protein
MEKVINKLNRIFCTILNLEECGNDESFLELGASSFEFTKLQMMIKKEFKKKISLKEIYHHNTVNSIAALICEESEVKFSITDMQKTVYIGRKKEVILGGSASKAYFELECNDYDTARFKQTVDTIIDRQVALRTAYPDESSCVVKHSVNIDIPEYDLRSLSDDEQKKQLEINRMKQYEMDFDPSSAPLISFSVSRLSDSKAMIHVSYDGLVSDGEGLDILIRELDAVYDGSEASVPCGLSNYCSYINELKTSDEFEEDRQYWAGMVNSISHRPRLSIMKRPEKVEKASAVQLVRAIDEDAYEALADTARKNNLTMFSLLLTVFGKTLSLYSENHSFFINIPMSVRPDDCDNIENTVGLCSNFTFVHFDDRQNLNLLETAQQTQDTLFDCREHSTFSGTDVLKLFQERIGASIPAPITFTSTIGNGDTHIAKHFRKHYVRTFTSQNWIEVLLTEMNGSKYFLMNYEPEIINVNVAEGIADCFIETIGRIANDRTVIQSMTSILPCTREQRLISSSALNHTGDGEKTYPMPGKALQDCFDRYADKTAIASMERTYSYDELRRAAESFLFVLENKCGRIPKRIALIMDKSPEQVIVSIACMCAGISYMPLETELPSDTQLACIKNIGAEALVVLGDYNPTEDIPVIKCGDAVFEETPESSRFKDDFGPDDEAVIINTSGTTGIPKSVSILNKGLSNCIFNSPTVFEIDYVPTAIAVTSLCHDMSLYDIYGILTLGGCIAVPSEQKKKEPAHWYELMTKFKVNFWNSVPAFMEMLTLLDKERVEKALQGLRTVVLGGDWISPALAKKLMTVSPETKLFSVGGPTETTVWNISHRITEADTDSSFIPYGKPFPSTSYYILNSQRSLCPVGVSGTMYVSGIGVTGGYIGNSEETAHRYTEYNGEKVYNTGDRGEYLANGEIRILGREDNQVKINGKRIELTGIESAIMSYDPVTMCVVIKDDQTEKLCAVYTSDKEIDEAHLKTCLADILQQYMIPQRYRRIDEFPKTVNGKINRKKIAELFKTDNTETVQQISETTPVDSVIGKLVEACKEIMDDDDITAEDDFYGIGGDSIAAMKIAAWANEEYHVEIQVFDILNNSELTEIAKLIEDSM